MSKKKERNPQVEESSMDINKTKNLQNPQVNPDVTIGGYNQESNQEEKSVSFLKNLKPGCEWFKNMEKKKKIALIGSMSALSLALITLAIVLPIVLTIPNPPEGIQVSEISYKDAQVIVNYAEVSRGRHQGTAHITHKGKVQFSYPTVDSITRMIRASNDQEQILFSIPIFSILETFGNGQKQQQVYKNWLDDYNANPRQTVNKLIKMIKEKMSKPGSEKFGKKIADNLTLTDIEEETLIDIIFDPVEQKFTAVKFDPNYVDPEKIEFEKKQNLKKEGNRKDRKSNKTQTQQTSESNKKWKNDKKKSDNPTGTEKTFDKDQLMARVMQSTIYYIKRVVSRSVQFLRSKSNQLLEYQKQIVSESQVDQEWQTVLVNDCKTLQSLRFRCKIDAAIKLDSDLTLEKIQSSNSEYVISQNLNLKFKQVKVTSE